MTTQRKTPTRRDILRGAMIVGGGLAAFGSGATLSQLAHAQQAPGSPDRYYIFCYFSGGWDTLLSLDPRDPRQFTNGNMRTTRIQPGYEFVERPDADLVRAGGLTFGPYIGDLTRHVDKLAVVRGMTMDTLTHEVGRRRFLTGKPPAGLSARGSNSSTWLAGHLGLGEPIPQLSVQVESYNTDQPNYASALRVNSVADLLRALRPSDPVLAPRVASLVDHRLTEAAECARAQRSGLWRAAETARNKARQMVEGGYADLFDFNNRRSDEIQALRSHYNIARVDSSPEVQAAMAVQAITGGVSRVVSIQMAARSLDTHFDEWETDQGPTQERGFNTVAKMVDDLASREYRDTGTSWLEHTTILGFSEFCRTPTLNDRGGRDHHLGNACFLLGGGVQGGQVIGASSDVGMLPTTTNLVTGRPSPDGEVVRPEHIIQSLFHEAGMVNDGADLRVGPIPALMRG
jgi:uncharacterized protein (DUF1501 family)